jgi:hypothetical protein
MLFGKDYEVKLEQICENKLPVKKVQYTTFKTEPPDRYEVRQSEIITRPPLDLPDL